MVLPKFVLKYGRPLTALQWRRLQGKITYPFILDKYRAHLDNNNVFYLFHLAGETSLEGQDHLVNNSSDWSWYYDEYLSPGERGTAHHWGNMYSLKSQLHSTAFQEALSDEKPRVLTAQRSNLRCVFQEGSSLSEINRVLSVLLDKQIPQFRWELVTLGIKLEGEFETQHRGMGLQRNIRQLLEQSAAGDLYRGQLDYNKLLEIAKMQRDASNSKPHRDIKLWFQHITQLSLTRPTLTGHNHHWLLFQKR